MPRLGCSVLATTIGRRPLYSNENGSLWHAKSLSALLMTSTAPPRPTRPPPSESTKSPTKSTCPIPTPPSCATRSTSGSLTPAESAAPRHPPADSPRKLLRAHRFGATILLTFVHGPARTVKQFRPATVIPTSPSAETPVSDTSPDHPPTASSPAVRVTRPGRVLPARRRRF